MRERNKQSVTNKEDVTLSPDGVTDNMLYPDGTKALLFPPSKFLSPEQDQLVQENVVNTMKTMSGSRLQSFRALGNAFTPNIKKDPTLKVPELT